MEKFDVLIVGSGSGMMIAEAAVNSGLKTALVEKGKLGGTCLNTGCIPSKMVIYPADIINQINHSKVLGVIADIKQVDFAGIMERTRNFIAHDRKPMEDAIYQVRNLKFYPVEGYFVDDYRMKVGEDEIIAENIFLVSGSRPFIPPIKGIDQVEFLTSENVWDLTTLPRSIAIAGGGFIACEMAHFFSSMGAEVTVLSRSPRLLKHGEPEISDILMTNLRQRIHIETDAEVKEVNKHGDLLEIIVEKKNGKSGIYEAEKIFLATGRIGNADLLKVENTGVEKDENGFIKVNQRYETSKDRIWALGDAIGKAMFKHVANKEAEIVWHSFSQGHFHPLDYDKVPYAVFSWPQVASVGLTEEVARSRRKKILIGEYNYIDTAKGSAMEEEDGYLKVVVEKESYKILGAHIIGAFAPILIQEVINVMHIKEGILHPLVDAIHIHPALPEVVQRAFYNLRDPDHTHEL
jgi:dihydrolipoamide dehydrogenase